jgi:hypothetical protein
MKYFKIIFLTTTLLCIGSTLALAQNKKRPREVDKSAGMAKDNRATVPAPPVVLQPALPPAQSTGATTSNPPKKERKPKAKIPAQSTEEPASSPTKVVKTRKSKTATQDAAITEQEIRDIREQIRILIYRVDALEKHHIQNV